MSRDSSPPDATRASGRAFQPLVELHLEGDVLSTRGRGGAASGAAAPRTCPPGMPSAGRSLLTARASFLRTGGALGGERRSRAGELLGGDFARSARCSRRSRSAVSSSSSSRAAAVTRGEHVGDRGAVFLLESKQQIAALLHGAASRLGIGLDRRLAYSRAACGQLIGVRERARRAAPASRRRDGSRRCSAARILCACAEPGRVERVCSSSRARRPSSSACASRLRFDLERVVLAHLGVRRARFPATRAAGSPLLRRTSSCRSVSSASRCSRALPGCSCASRTATRSTSASAYASSMSRWASGRSSDCVSCWPWRSTSNAPICRQHADRRGRAVHPGARRAFAQRLRA